MKRKSRISIMSIFLSLIMVISILPATASAVQKLNYAETTVIAPAAGETPYYSNILPDTAHSTADVLGWYHGDDFKSAAVMSSQETYQENHTYWVQVEFMPWDGYQFVPKPTGVINGQNGDGPCYVQRDGTFIVTRKFVAPALKTLNYANCTLTEPDVGDVPDFAAKDIEGLNSTVTHVSWSKGPTFSTSKIMDPLETYKPGMTYWCRVWFTPNPGYRFISKTNACINDQEGTELNYISDGDFMTARKFVIPDLNVLNYAECMITAPATGKKPAYTVTVPDTLHSRAEVGNWYCGPNYQGSVLMEKDETFKAGETYWVTVYFTPNPGYRFHPTTSAYVNYEEGTELNYVHKDGRFITACKFVAGDPVIPVISKVSATVKEPVIGQTPDYTAAVPSGADYTAAVYRWYQGNTWNEAKTISENAEFSAETTYWASVCFTPKEGKQMASSTRADINGIPGKALNYVIDRDSPMKGTYLSAIPFKTGKAAEEEFTLSFETNGGSKLAAITKKKGSIIDLGAYEPTRAGYDFAGWFQDSGLKKQVKSVELKGNLTVYAKWAEAEKPAENPFTDVPDKSVFKEAILWAAGSGITSGKTATTFEPNAPCTRGQAVTFLWRAAGSPAPKSSKMPFTDVSDKSVFKNAILWAVEQEITLGTSATTFDPNQRCTRGQIVTFLWRDQGKPHAVAELPFTDVVENSPFRNAIVWAVKNGVTTGKTARTFAPGDACTRAQIVTFMYRALAE